MKYSILSIALFFGFVHRFNGEPCSSSNFKYCEKIQGSNEDKIHILECCITPNNKNSRHSSKLVNDQLCFKETKYCCNNLSESRCKNVIKNLQNSTNKGTRTTKKIGRNATRSQSTTIQHPNSQDNNNTLIYFEDTNILTNETTFVSQEIDRVKERENTANPTNEESYKIPQNSSSLAQGNESHSLSVMEEIANPVYAMSIDSEDSKGVSKNKTVDSHKLETNQHVQYNQTSTDNLYNPGNDKNNETNEFVPAKVPPNPVSIDLGNNETAKKPEKLENSTVIIESTSKIQNSTIHSASKIPAINTEPTTTTAPTTSTARPLTKSELKCIEYGQSNIQKMRVTGLIGQKPREITIDKCRHRVIALIVGGREAMPYEFPHHALLGYDKNDQTEWKCGGSLVSRNFILTAAHCVDSYELGHPKFAKFGIFNKFQPTEKTVTRMIVDHFIHPDYDRLNLLDDIGLLKLDAFVPFNEFINPICLPSKQSTNEHAVAIGYGATERYSSSNRLMKVVLEKFDPHYPMRIQNETRVDKFIFYGHRTQRKDTCSGDSGSPLQISNEMNVKCSYTQIGIVSYGPNECGILGVPAVYVNVFYYMDWIQKYIWVDEDQLEEQSRSQENPEKY